MPKIRSFSLVLLLLILSGCSINHEVFIDDDLSGYVDFKADYGMMAGMMDLMSEDGDVEANLMLGEFDSLITEFTGGEDGIAESLNEIEGLSEIRVISGGHKMEFSFSFKDIHSYNRSQQAISRSLDLSEDGRGMGNGFQGSETRLKFHHLTPALKFMDRPEETPGLFEIEELIQHSHVIRFQREIKRFKGSNAEQLDDHTIEITYPAGYMYSDEPMAQTFSLKLQK